MAWKDSDQKFEMTDEAPVEQDDEQAPPPPQATKSLMERTFRKGEMPWGWITAGALFIIILLVLFFPRSSGDEFRERIDALENRLIQIEGRLAQDDRLIDRTLALAGVRAAPFEFQMLYGVRGDRQRELAAASHSMRIYVPYGSQWYAYLTRRLAERPANMLFFIRALVGSS